MEVGGTDAAMLASGVVNAAMRWLPYLVAGWLAVIALYGLVTSRNLVHMVACLTVLQSATYLLFVAIGYTRGGEAPIFYDRPADTIVVDALVQALCLTDIVVGAGITGLLLALVLQIHRRKGTISTEALRMKRK